MKRVEKYKYLHEFLSLDYNGMVNYIEGNAQANEMVAQEGHDVSMWDKEVNHMIQILSKLYNKDYYLTKNFDLLERND